ncbi:hypothetical protein, partial [Escherichia coli]|uniref:hypothetical protein n=1 Tax=Escherichia coli TaxID=562 RepID=UPI001BC83499
GLTVPNPAARSGACALRSIAPACRVKSSSSPAITSAKTNRSPPTPPEIVFFPNLPSAIPSTSWPFDARPNILSDHWYIYIDHRVSVFVFYSMLIYQILLHVLQTKIELSFDLNG